MLLNKEHFFALNAGPCRDLSGPDLLGHVVQPSLALGRFKQKVPDRVVLARRQAQCAVAAHMGLQPVHFFAVQRQLHHGKRGARAVAALGNVLVRATHSKQFKGSDGPDYTVVVQDGVQGQIMRLRMEVIHIAIGVA